jgi:hypothetical protein
MENVLLLVASSLSVLLPHCSGTYEYNKLLEFTETVSRIRISFNADPDPASYLKAGPSPAQTVTKSLIF